MGELIVNVVQRGASASEGVTGDHRITIDRPKDKDGADEGPMGGEVFLIGLGGCFMSNLLAAIRARSSKISDARVEVKATVEGTPPRMVGFALSVSARYEDREEMEKLALIAERGCIVANSLKPHFPVSVRVV